MLILVTGKLSGGTPFEAAAAAHTWKPLGYWDFEITEAMGRQAHTFCWNQPIVISCNFEIDPRAGTGLRSSLLIRVFGKRYETPWLPVAPGSRHLGYRLLVPAGWGTECGGEFMKLTVRLSKNGLLYDKALAGPGWQGALIEVCPCTRTDWEPRPP